MFKYAILLLIHEKRSLLAICLQNPSCCHLASMSNFHGRLFFFYWRYNPMWICILQPSSGVIASSRTRFIDHTQRRATVGRTPLDEWSQHVSRYKKFFFIFLKQNSKQLYIFRHTYKSTKIFTFQCFMWYSIKQF